MIRILMQLVGLQIYMIYYKSCRTSSRKEVMINGRNYCCFRSFCPGRYSQLLYLQMAGQKEKAVAWRSKPPYIKEHRKPQESRTLLGFRFSPALLSHSLQFQYSRFFYVCQWHFEKSKIAKMWFLFVFYINPITFSTYSHPVMVKALARVVMRTVLEVRAPSWSIFLAMM